MNVLRQRACVVVNPIMVDKFVSTLISRQRILQSDGTVDPSIIFTINVCALAHRSHTCGFLVLVSVHFSIVNFVSA